MPLFVNTSSTPSGKRFNRRRKRKKLSDGKKALKMVRQIKSGVEKKFIQVFFQDQQVDWDGNSFSLNETNIGANDDGQRVGDKITMTSLEIRLKVGPNINMALPQTVRVIVIVDKHNTINPPDIFLPVGGNLYQPYKMYTIDLRKHFTVLFDKTIRIGGNETTDSSRVQNRTWFKSLKNRNVQYQAQTDFANTNAVKLMIWSGFNPTASDDIKPNIFGYSRIRYTDM